ncbi:unnamed protein product [marine sediment metagenome]|uniref:Uncharacterized protein n=1 Tax=marine sediment metagenome TaxID=412755 RepID=X0TM96_9ZZZZ
MKKYDGWIIKHLTSESWIYLFWTFKTTRKEAIQEFEENWHTVYSIRRNLKMCKAVKIKLVEVK